MVFAHFTAEQMSKYRVVSSDGTHINEAALLKQEYPNVVSLRYFRPTLYQAEMWSMPFLGTGPATAGKNVYAGHWLYLAGTKTLNDINSTDSNVKVEDISNFTIGTYVVIYDAPAGSFKNAEHAYVADINTSTKTIKLSKRGSYSSATYHAANSIIATHVFDAEDDDIFVGGWSYNLSSHCPRDANGKTLVEAMADWLGVNLNKNSAGTIVNAYDGIIFDTDGWRTAAQNDVNDDLIPDGGFFDSVNTWNVGLETLYSRVRNYFPNSFIVSGSPNSRGFSTLNGTQMEGLPATYHLVYPPVYTIMDELMQKYSMHMHHQGVSPVFCECKSKIPTLLYDPGIAKDNSPFRFSFAMTMMEDGYYANGGYDHWFDEYAVNINKSSKDYGTAILSNDLDESQVRANVGWLGFPLGARYRIYDHVKFNDAHNLIKNGSLEHNLNGWSANIRFKKYAVNFNKDKKTSAEGSASFHASPMNVYSSGTQGAKIYAPAVKLKAGKQYTICFSAKASKLRASTLQFANMQQEFYFTTEWLKYVACFTADASGEFSPTFLIGQENSDIWLDAVYVFEGNADIFRRDFDNGIVIANATPDTVHIDLGGRFQRIKGTGQDPINDGSIIRKVRLAPYDAAILVRPVTNQTKASSPSNIAANADKKNQSFVKASPNPVTSVLNVDFAITGQDIELEIISMSGQKVLRKHLTAQGIANEKINVANIQAGMYYLLIKSNSEKLTAKFEKL